MVLNYPQKSNGMFILKKTDFDNIAVSYLKENLAKALDRAAPVDICHIAEEVCYLTVIPKQITKSGVVLGLVAFGDTDLQLYNDQNQKETIPVTEGTVIIEKYLTTENHIERYRFTLAHEVAHWLLHRSYHSPMQKKYQLRGIKEYVVCRKQDVECANRQFQTDNDWEEWQADSLAASLLMPKDIFASAFNYVVASNRFSKESIYGRFSRETEASLKKEMSKVFKVSKKAIEIRLKDLGYINPNATFFSAIDVFAD